MIVTFDEVSYIPGMLYLALGVVHPIQVYYLVTWCMLYDANTKRDTAAAVTKWAEVRFEIRKTPLLALNLSLIHI